jgi:hypothetical protein
MLVSGGLTSVPPKATCAMRRLRSIGQGRFQRDGDGRFTIVNTEFERIAGRPRGEILGRRGDELELGLGGRRFSAHDGPEVLEPGGTELFEKVLDGRTYVSLRFPLTSADGRILGMAGISTDVTARHRAEERFRRAFEAAPIGMDVARGSLPARQRRCARSPATRPTSSRRPPTRRSPTPTTSPARRRGAGRRWRTSPPAASSATSATSPPPATP